MENSKVLYHSDENLEGTLEFQTEANVNRQTKSLGFVICSLYFHNSFRSDCIAHI